MLFVHCVVEMNNDLNHFCDVFHMFLYNLFMHATVSDAFIDVSNTIQSFF